VRGRIETSIALMPCCCAATSPSSAIRFRAGTETAITRELRAIPVDRNHVIDHHYIAGRLKPYCWRPWADDPTGFPQARYLAALVTAPSAPEETVNSFPVPEVPSVATVPAGTWLYATSALEPSPDNICVDPGRDMPYLGQPASEVRIVEYVDARRPSEVVDVREGVRGHQHPPGARLHAVQPGSARRCREGRGRGGQGGRRPRGRRVRSVTRDG
jgi:hypothetical protein